MIHIIRELSECNTLHTSKKVGEVFIKMVVRFISDMHGARNLPFFTVSGNFKQAGTKSIVYSL